MTVESTVLLALELDEFYGNVTNYGWKCMIKY